MSNVTISYYESGRCQPPFANLRRLAISLNISSDYLLGLTHASADEVLAAADGIDPAEYADLPKREAAAVAAMQGILANPQTPIDLAQWPASERKAVVAEQAVDQADTLFDALEKKETK